MQKPPIESLNVEFHVPDSIVYATMNNNYSDYLSFHYSSITALLLLACEILYLIRGKYGKKMCILKDGKGC